MTSQQQADSLLASWQLQRLMGRKPEERKLDTTELSDSAEARDLDVIRRCVARDLIETTSWRDK